MSEDRMKHVEKIVYNWFLNNKDKTDFKHGYWWSIKNDFIETAIETMAIGLEEYQDFYQMKAEEFGLVPIGTGE